MPTELELLALETEFELYLPFSKRLVLNLPDSADRARAAQWLMKLRSIKDDNYKKLRNEHLKLLLFALHRRTMVGIFEKRPPKDELESFHDGCTLLEMTRELIEINEKRVQQSGGNKDLKPGECPLPKVYANFSSDLKEYSASQNIPKFGAHVFYAVSSQPIQFWNKSGNSDYPAMGDIPNSMQWEHVFKKLSDHVLEKQHEMDKKIALQKAIEAGDASPDDLEPAIDFSKKIQVQTCPTDQFKWKKDSLLRIYQNYDFSDVKDAEDIETQGRIQLENDEEAFTLLDTSLPGRRRLSIRDPYYEGLPHDIALRRHHGVVEEIPYEEDSDECDVCSTCSEDDATKGPQECEVCLCDTQKTPSTPCDVCASDGPSGGDSSKLCGGGGVSLGGGKSSSGGGRSSSQSGGGSCRPCGGGGVASACDGPASSPCSGGRASSGGGTKTSANGVARSSSPCGATSQEALIQTCITENDRSVHVTDHVDIFESEDLPYNKSEKCLRTVCSDACEESEANSSDFNQKSQTNKGNPNGYISGSDYVADVLVGLNEGNANTFNADSGLTAVAQLGLNKGIANGNITGRGLMLDMQVGLKGTANENIARCDCLVDMPVGLNQDNANGYIVGGDLNADMPLSLNENNADLYIVGGDLTADIQVERNYNNVNNNMGEIANVSNNISLINHSTDPTANTNVASFNNKPYRSRKNVRKADNPDINSDVNVKTKRDKLGGCANETSTPETRSILKKNLKRSVPKKSLNNSSAVKNTKDKFPSTCGLNTSKNSSVPNSANKCSHHVYPNRSIKRSDNSTKTAPRRISDQSDIVLSLANNVPDKNLQTSRGNLDNTVKNNNIGNQFSEAPATPTSHLKKVCFPDKHEPTSNQFSEAPATSISCSKKVCSPGRHAPNKNDAKRSGNDNVPNNYTGNKFDKETPEVVNIFTKKYNPGNEISPDMHSTGFDYSNYPDSINKCRMNSKMKIPKSVSFSENVDHSDSVWPNNCVVQTQNLSNHIWSNENIGQPNNFTKPSANLNEKVDYSNTLWSSSDSLIETQELSNHVWSNEKIGQPESNFIKPSIKVCSKPCALPKNKIVNRTNESNNQGVSSKPFPANENSTSKNYINQYSSYYYNTPCPVVKTESDVGCSCGNHNESCSISRKEESISSHVTPSKAKVKSRNVKSRGLNEKSFEKT